MNIQQKKQSRFLAQFYKLTEEESSELLPTRTQSTFSKRVHWAIAHFKMAHFWKILSEDIIK